MNEFHELAMDVKKIADFSSLMPDQLDTLYRAVAIIADIPIFCEKFIKELEQVEKERDELKTAIENLRQEYWNHLLKDKK